MHNIIRSYNIHTSVYNIRVVVMILCIRGAYNTTLIHPSTFHCFVPQDRVARSPSRVLCFVPHYERVTHLFSLSLGSKNRSLQSGPPYPTLSLQPIFLTISKWSAKKKFSYCTGARQETLSRPRSTSQKRSPRSSPMKRSRYPPGICRWTTSSS